MAIRHFPPPALAERLAARALDEEERAARLGDLEERFQVLARDRGERRARAWYRWQALLLTILAFINHTQWSGIMFKNNLIIAWRNIKKYKGFSLINIAGLVLGFTIFILITIYIRYEFSYDRFHKNAGSIYRVISKSDRAVDGSAWWNATPGLLKCAPG
jgi:putative ABC transport system permease protein